MSKNNLWMPFYIGDYLADTIDLSLSEHGAYVLSIFAYWRNHGALTPQQLRGASGREFQRVSQFFILCDGLYHHKRIDEELQKSSNIHDSLVKRALLGVAARRKLGSLPPSKN